MPHAPRTMTLLGLKFLGSLAAQKKDGVYLEIGPLFGSSTNAIHQTRIGNAPIHTIDTFEPAPWVRKRFGMDLSRELFEKFTDDINNMVVHEGFSPDVVKDTWKDDIGFYFDDATHGDPGWSDNFNFFSRFFDDETIVSGDDFSSSWPHIVRNVYSIAEDWGAKLYVIGRVWVIVRKGEKRIVAAVDKVCPKLKGVNITTHHNDDIRTNMAACWTWGLHQENPLNSFSIDGGAQLTGQITTFQNGSIKDTVSISNGNVALSEIDQLYFSFDKEITVQLCLINAKGQTRNTKAYNSGRMIEIPGGSRIAALRLSDT